jgi:Fe-Mn family superoxide dismutase
MNCEIKNLEFPTLAYSFNALEPHIDAMTMEIHFTRHHKAYFDNLRNATTGTEMENLSFESVLSNISKYPTAVKNNGGGHFNHSLFWTVLSPNGGGKPAGELAKAITQNFGSFEKLQETFNNAAKTRFGSGWAWLSIAENQSLIVSSTPNQDNPLMDVAEIKGTPILGLDVWEHAYYLNYQNKRPDYVSAFWNLINWEEVTKRYERALVG